MKSTDAASGAWVYRPTVGWRRPSSQRSTVRDGSGTDRTARCSKRDSCTSQDEVTVHGKYVLPSAIVRPISFGEPPACVAHKL